MYHNSNTQDFKTLFGSRRGSISLGLLFIWLLCLASVAGTFVFFASDRFNPTPPLSRFVDVTDSSGVDFIHNNGASEDRLLPETMGSGVAFFDFDNDGDQDLIFANSDYWAWQRTDDTESTRAAVYRNNGDGYFEEVAEELGFTVSMYGMGIAIGDYDNDGWSDVFLSGVGTNRLFRNEGGVAFSEVTSAAGVEGLENDWSTSAAWVDLNNDGFLDLFVCNYVRWARDLGIEMAFKLAGIGHSYSPQVAFTGTIPYLYLNNGDGTFREASQSSGLDLYDEASGYPLARSLAVAPIDLDEDGWMDLVVANHEMDDFIFRNLGKGRFEEVGTHYRSNEGDDGQEGMGIDVARLSESNGEGLFVGSFANELNQMYRKSGDSVVFARSAISASDTALTSLQRFGMFFFDYDLDGRLDLLAVNGFLEREINRIDPDTDFRRSAQLFWNAGPRSNNSFLEVTEDKVGDSVFRPVIGRGAAFADINGDGSLDVVVTQNGDRPMILKNVAPEGRNYVRLKLVGTRSNRDAIGSKVSLRVGNRVLHGRVMPTRSYLSQSELPITIGLDRGWKVKGVTVTWPDGTEQEFEDIAINSQTILVQK